MNFLSKIISVYKRGIDRGRKRQAKEDFSIIEKLNLDIERLKISKDEEIKKIIQAQKEEIDRIQKNCDIMIKNNIDHNEKTIANFQENKQLEIKKLQKQQESDIAAIRNQVKDHYEPLLQERNDEIAKLNAEKIDQKKYYKSILDYGIAMENSGERAAGYFSRAQGKVREAVEFANQTQVKFGEAMQLIDRGNACVEAIQDRVGKTTPRLLKNIKE